jgi:RNA polymerase sigma factor (sigma-70 family)
MGVLPPAVDGSDRFDAAAIEALYRTHGGLALRRARSILGNEDDARDAIQNIFTRLLLKPESFQGRSRPATFLYAVTTNHCLATLRDRKNRRRIVDDHVAPSLARSQAPTGDHRNELRLLLARLSDDVAQVVVYYYIDEMSQDQIAEVLGIGRRAVAAALALATHTARTAAQEHDHV